MATNPWDVYGGPSGDWAQFSKKYNLGIGAIGTLQSQGYTPETAPAYVEKLQGSVGIGGITTSTGGGQSYGGNQSSTQQYTTQGGLGLSDLIQLGGALGINSGAGADQKKAAPVDPVAAADAARQANPLGALGTAALGAVGLGDYGGSNLYTNPNPATGKWDVKSGTSKVPGVAITPMGGAATAGQGATGAGTTGTTGAAGAGATGAGITTTVPSIFTKAPMPAGTPAAPQIFPSQQATAAQYNPGQAFAIAPQQPVMPPPAAPQGQGVPAQMTPPQAPDNSGALKSWSQLGASAGAGYGHDSQNAGGGLSAGIGGLANAAQMWQNKNYAAGGVGTPQSLGQLPAGGGGGDMSGLGSGAYSGGKGATVGGAGGASAASKQAGLALIAQAGHAGDALKDYGANASWKMQPSAIPSPDDFKYAGPAIAFNPMRTYGNA